MDSGELVEGSVSCDFNEGGYEVDRACGAKKDPGGESREVGVLPDSEMAKTPVDTDGNDRQQEPDSRGRLHVVETPDHRIDQETEEESEVDPEASGADRERCSEKAIGALALLMAKKAEKPIDDLR